MRICSVGLALLLVIGTSSQVFAQSGTGQGGGGGGGSSYSIESDTVTATRFEDWWWGFPHSYLWTDNPTIGLLYGDAPDEYMLDMFEVSADINVPDGEDYKIKFRVRWYRDEEPFDAWHDIDESASPTGTGTGSVENVSANFLVGWTEDPADKPHSAHVGPCFIIDLECTPYDVEFILSIKQADGSYADVETDIEENVEPQLNL